jgi:hypothetical protein
MELAQYFFGNFWHFAELVIVLCILAAAVKRK